MELQKLAELLKNHCIEKEISSFHFNFIDKKSSEILDSVNFYQRIGIQYYWYNKYFALL